MKRTVIIDSFPESAQRYTASYAVVAVDVIRATTTITTGVSLGKSIYPARTSDEAFIIASKLKDPVMMGELGGNMPFGFTITNSPVQINSMPGTEHPIVFVSSSGTQLIVNASGAKAVYTACLRNFTALANYMSGRHERVAVIGAGTRGQFRREDQIGCAWVAERLMCAGYSPENMETAEYVRRWSGADLNVIRDGKSARYLMNSGQAGDLEFVLSHIDDLATVPVLVNGRIENAA